MRRILVKSLNEAFDFVMDHYYPAGCEEDAKRKDTYAVISIQDTHTGGFGVTFAENKFCKGVLTLYCLMKIWQILLSHLFAVIWM